MTEQRSKLTFLKPETPAQRERALQVLLENRSPEAQAALEAAAQSVDEELLIAALRGEQVVGAVFAQRQPGKVALVWPPRTTAEETGNTAGELFRELLDRLRLDGVQVVQAFPDVPGHADQQLLAAAGFEHVADLLYLVCTEAGFPTAPPTLSIELEACCDANLARLSEVLERSYEGTLDCPRLNGVRSAEDVLETYRAAGVFDAARWFLVRANQQDVGCLLLADHPQDEQWELVYIGLVPAARGQGIGRDLVRQAQWLTRQAGRRRLVLSVDAANAPALGLYASEGFAAWDRRAIYLQIFTQAAERDRFQ